jgi:AraC-like DNA-binding protein
MVVMDPRSSVAIARSPMVHGVEVTEVFGHQVPREPRVVSAYEVAVCQNGEVQSFQRGRLQRLAPGEVAVAEPGEVVRVIGSSAAVRCQAVRLDADIVPWGQESGSEAEGREAGFRFAETRIVDGTLAEAIAALVEAIRGPVSAGEQRRRLAVVLDRAGAHLGPRSVGRRTWPKADLVRRVREYLEGHYAESVPLPDLAQQVGVTASYLIRLFRLQVGLPPHAYQARIRVNRAQALLRQGVRPADVATETGYADQSHLTRHFRRVVGVTPARYQAAYL